MITLPLRIIDLPVPLPAQPSPRPKRLRRRGRLGALLLGSGLITPDALHEALARQAECGAPLGEILCRTAAIDETALFDALAQQFGTCRVNPADYQPDTELVDRLGAGFCVTHGVLPLARAGAIAVVATCEPDRFDVVRPALESAFGPVAMVLTRKTDLHRAIIILRRRSLARAAEARCPPRLSCRTLSGRLLVGGGVGLVVGLAFAIGLAPKISLSVLIWLALAVLVFNTGFAATMAVIWLMGRRDIAPPQPPLRPVPVSIIVPLFRERQIAQRLINRLARLDYPAEQLEILLVMEEDDHITQATLQPATCP